MGSKSRSREFHNTPRYIGSGGRHHRSCPRWCRRCRFRIFPRCRRDRLRRPAGRMRRSGHSSQRKRSCGSGINRIIRPLPAAAEPFNAADAPGKFRGDSRIKIAALVKTPRNETGAPLHTGIKSVPRPIGLTAHIADLRQRYLDDGIIPGINTIENSRPQPAVFLGKQFGKLLPLVGGEIEMICHFLGGLVADHNLESVNFARWKTGHGVPLCTLTAKRTYLAS